jgi:hypothetical protein
MLQLQLLESVLSLIRSPLRSYRDLDPHNVPDEQVDAERGGLLDYQALEAFKAFVCTSVAPAPTPAAIRKHVEALATARQWRVRARSRIAEVRAPRRTPRAFAFCTRPRALYTTSRAPRSAHTDRASSPRPSVHR